MKICLQCNNNLSDTGWNCSTCGWRPNVVNGITLLAPDLATGFPDYPMQAHSRCARLQEANFWFICRNQIITYFIQKHFSNTGKLLEIGCGTGYVLSGISRAFPNMKLFGAEAYPSALNYAKANVPNSVFVQMDAYRFPYIEEFNVVGAFDVLEHLSDDKLVLREIYKSIRPGGGLIITVPQHPWLWSILDDQAGHKRRYSRKELREKVSTAGFEVLFMTSFMTLLLPFMWWSRRGKSLDGKNKSSDTRCELKLSKPLNAIFKFICSIEVFLIRKGVMLPSGGSLLCVARVGGGNEQT